MATATKSGVRTSATKTNANATDNISATPIRAKEIDIHQYITVLNGFQGELIYKSRKTGELFTWEKFGEEQETELAELRDAKNSSKKFFINNWFMFKPDDDWVIDFLGVRRFYKNSLGIDNFDEIFEKPPAEIKRVVSELSDGQKKSVMYRAKELISNGGIDSMKAVEALEDALSMEIIER